MFTRHGTRTSRVGIAVLLLVATALTFSGSAAGEESLSDLQARMDSIQGELDATTVKIERLRESIEELEGQVAIIETRMADLQKERDRLTADAVARADSLYRSGAIGMAEALFTSDNFSELSTRAELLSQVSAEDSGVFIKLSRTQNELDLLSDDLTRREAELERAAQELAAENKRLQAQFRSVAAEHKRLRRRLAQAQASAPSTGSVSSGAAAAPVRIKVSGDMTCPVAGPVSFVDSWGAPRSGHTHQGVDMMGDYGTPLVAITSGTITYAAYDGSGGNMIFLSGDDGNDYWYMHNQENLVSGGHVEVGQQIATLGDTGNAAGTPHLHFEFHPGRGAAVNPYPLVSSLC